MSTRVTPGVLRASPAIWSRSRALSTGPRSVTTLSAVIFLVTPSTQLAAVSVLLLDDSGNQNQAAAFSVCIMGIVALALALFHALLAFVARRRARARASA